ncbi:multidrug DMT transporter permease [Streptomyces sp. CNQ-509]|uniref:EamA family transporter n=1 Tax=Streptomyces sp. CNQ-509 TaxID=444103 RepID=UPI00062DDFF5|nr:EamA family transporter [Streptomyces sp. CNQ-509]AKH82037.1 multidrug DMT transporter permease [Streptomyces sp. CNQ-509]
MGELLALSSAVSFGLTHFVAGLAARRTAGVTVAFYAQVCGTAVSVTAAPAAPGAGALTAAGLGWGAVSGVGTGVGVAFLYRALAKGAMSVVVPVSDVTAVAVPVVIGISLLGERPAAAALACIAAAFPALWLVSRGPDRAAGAAGREVHALPVPGREERGPAPAARRARGSASVDALIAGAGFAAHFVAIARMPAEGDLWAITVSRVVSVAVVALAVLGDRAPWGLPRRCAPHVAAAGALGTLATVLYLYAARAELMAVATVLAALYPAIPVLLALLVLRERLTLLQSAGLVCAGAAIGLIAVA